MNYLGSWENETNIPHTDLSYYTLRIFDSMQSLIRELLIRTDIEASDDY